MTHFACSWAVLAFSVILALTSFSYALRFAFAASKSLTSLSCSFSASFLRFCSPLPHLSSAFRISRGMT